MTSLLRIGIGINGQIAKSARLACLEGVAVRRWVAAGSSEHTLHVRQQIQETRKKTLQGGGPKRIEAQHKKVLSGNNCY